MIISLSAACSLKVNCGKLMPEHYGTLTKQRRQSASLSLTEICPDSQNMQKGLVPQKEHDESRLAWEEWMKLCSALPFLVWGNILQAEAGLTLAA